MCLLVCCCNTPSFLWRASILVSNILHILSSTITATIQWNQWNNKFKGNRDTEYDLSQVMSHTVIRMGLRVC